MLWPSLAMYGDWALLALRLMVAAVFFTSGLSHAREPTKRAASAVGAGSGSAAGSLIPISVPPIAARELHRRPSLAISQSPTARSTLPIETPIQVADALPGVERHPARVLE